MSLPRRGVSLPVLRASRGRLVVLLDGAQLGGREGVWFRVCAPRLSLTVLFKLTFFKLYFLKQNSNRGFLQCMDMILRSQNL